MVTFHVEYQPPLLDGWANFERRTRMTPVAAFRMFQGNRLFTRDEEQVLQAFMGKYCILDDLQQSRQPPEQMTISIHDKSPRHGTVYEEPPDDEETPGRSYSDDGYSQGYLDYLRDEYHGGRHRDSDFWMMTTTYARTMAMVIAQQAD